MGLTGMLFIKVSVVVKMPRISHRRNSAHPAVGVVEKTSYKGGF